MSPVFTILVLLATDVLMLVPQLRKSQQCSMCHYGGNSHQMQRVKIIA